MGDVQHPITFLVYKSSTFSINDKNLNDIRSHKHWSYSKHVFTHVERVIQSNFQNSIYRCLKVDLEKMEKGKNSLKSINVWMIDLVVLCRYCIWMGFFIGKFLFICFFSSFTFFMIGNLPWLFELVSLKWNMIRRRC